MSFNLTNTSFEFFLITEETSPANAITGRAEPIMSDEIYEWSINALAIMAFCFGTMGIITNVINIRVFVKQGILSDSNTIGLFALAVADLSGCLTAFPGPFCNIGMYVSGQIWYINCVTFTAIFCSLPHMMMSRVTCWVTVYIAVERSLCVLIPFKVKSLLQPKVAIIAMILIYGIIIGSYLPLFANIRIFWIFHPILNGTIAYSTEGEMGKLVLEYSSFIFNNILTVMAFFVMLVATFLLMYKLRVSMKWRQSTASAGGAGAGGGTISGKDESSGNPEKSSQAKRDLEVIKTVSMITGLFLICLSMSYIPGIATSLLPGMSFSGFNKNLFYFTYSYKIMFDLINSSLNFFFYIRVSSRYKQAFAQVFGGKKSAEKR